MYKTPPTHVKELLGSCNWCHSFFHWTSCWPKQWCGRLWVNSSFSLCMTIAQLSVSHILLHPSRTAPSFIALAKCHSIQDFWLLWILLVVCLAPRKGLPESPHRETWVGSVSWAAASSKAPGGPALQKADWSSLTIHWVLNMKYVSSKANAIIPCGTCLLDQGWRMQHLAAFSLKVKQGSLLHDLGSYRHSQGTVQYLRAGVSHLSAQITDSLLLLSTENWVNAWLLGIIIGGLYKISPPFLFLSSFFFNRKCPKNNRGRRQKQNLGHFTSDTSSRMV